MKDDLRSSQHHPDNSSRQIPSSAPPFPRWPETASELRAYREQQRQMWGDLDTSTLGRYLADDVSREEREEVEAALRSYPELRRLTDLVRDVLSDCEPIPDAGNSPLAVPTVAPEPAVLPFRPRPARRRPAVSRTRRYASLLAAACLLLGLGLFLSWPPARTDLSSPGHSQGSEEALARVMAPAPGDRASRVAVLPPPPGPAAELSARQREEIAELDRQVEEHVRQGNLEAALSAAEKYSAVADGQGDGESHLLVLRLAQLGGVYRDKGALEQAEPALRKAQTIALASYGADDPRTVAYTRQLANLYETALNAPEERTTFKIQPASLPATSPPSSPPAAAVMAAANPEPEARGGSSDEDTVAGQRRLLRERLTRKQPGEVEGDVLPVLLRAFRTARGSEERVRYVRAIAELGPAARAAAPLLVQRLRARSCPEEHAAILAALGRIGPASAQTLPALKEYLCGGDSCCEVAVDALLRCGPQGRIALDDVARTARSANSSIAPQIEARLRSCDVAAGIVDGAQLFSPYMLRRIQVTLAELASRSGVDVFVETVLETPSGKLGLPEERARLLGIDGVFILVSLEPATVQVHLNDLARRRLSTAQQQQLQKRLEELLHSHDYDRLLAAIPEQLALSAQEPGRP